MDRCPHCGKELEMGYGLAGGGIGAYQYCPEHGIIDKWLDPELSTPEEMAEERHRKAKEALASQPISPLGATADQDSKP